MSLAQIAASTKISTMVLEALERNDVSRLPGGLFSRAFVRAYAREVGLDPGRTVDEFIARFGDELDGGEQPRHAAGGYGSRGAGLRWFGLALTVALIGLFFGVQRYLSRNEGSAGVPGGSAGGRGQAKAVIQPPVASPPPAPTPTPAAGQPAAATTGSDGLPLRLVLTTTAPCWVSAKLDGTRAAAGRTVPSGERLEFGAAETIVLTVGDAGAFTYTINGTPGRSMGKPGEVVTSVISTGNYQSYIQR